MKKNLISGILIFCFTLITQQSFSQQVAELESLPQINKADSSKEKLIEAYPWIKNFFEKNNEDLVKIEKYNYTDNTSFVMIETTDKKILYDDQGEKYCTNSPTLECIEFYKLKPGKLSWQK